MTWKLKTSLRCTAHLSRPSHNTPVRHSVMVKHEYKPRKEDQLPTGKYLFSYFTSVCRESMQICVDILYEFSFQIPVFTENRRHYLLTLKSLQKIEIQTFLLSLLHSYQTIYLLLLTSLIKVWSSIIRLISHWNYYKCFPLKGDMINQEDDCQHNYFI